jgi:hypothetical protein
VLSLVSLSATTTCTGDKTFRLAYRDLRNLSSPSYIKFFYVVPFLNSAQEKFYFLSSLLSAFSYPYISFFLSAHTCFSSFFRILSVLTLADIVEADESKRCGKNFKIKVQKKENHQLNVQKGGVNFYGRG